MNRLALALLSLALPASAQPALSNADPAQGQLILTQFLAAPFPHPDRAQGYRYQQQFFSAKDHYSDSTVALFIPKGFRETGRIDFVVHFHGWRNHVANVLPRYQLLEQLLASGRNAVLVVPQGPYDAPDSFGGKLEDPGGFKRFLDEVAATLRQKSSLQRKDFTLGDIILSAHSGGYRVAAAILDHGGLTSLIKEVWLFDALYAQTDKFLAWAGPGRRFLDLYTEHGGTKAETEQLMATLKQRGTPFLAGNEAEITPAQLRASQFVFLFTDLAHDDVVNKRSTFRSFLETSCLASR